MIDAPLITLNGVALAYGAVPVLHGIDLTVQRGEVVALIGRSGSGKSSLLRAINGLAPICAGEVQVASHRLLPGDPSPASLRALRREVGMVFQKFNLFPHLSARENVALALRTVLGQGRREASARAVKLLDQVGLAARAGAFPHQLSGGQQQRVAIARALAMQPQVLLCDEITSALDPELTGEVLAVIRELADEGMTLLMATHEMAFAREVADTLIFLQDGRVHESGPAHACFGQPRSSELARFIGVARAEAGPSCTAD